MFYPKPEKAKKSRPRRGSPQYERAKAETLALDRKCFMIRLNPYHLCHDQFGNEHEATDLRQLTVEHVKKELRLGLRADDKPEFMVALCWAENLRPPTKETREAMRAYLAMHYPAVWT